MLARILAALLVVGVIISSAGAAWFPLKKGGVLAENIDILGELITDREKELIQVIIDERFAHKLFVEEWTLKLWILLGILVILVILVIVILYTIESEKFRLAKKLENKKEKAKIKVK